MTYTSIKLTISVPFGTAVANELIFPVACASPKHSSTISASTFVLICLSWFLPEPTGITTTLPMLLEQSIEIVTESMIVN